MNTYRHDEEQRRQWVLDKIQKRKKVKQILAEAQISRATLYNWIEEFASQQSVVGNQQEKAEQELAKPQASLPTNKALPIYQPATRQRMLLAALEKVDSDKTIARKLAATLVKRFTLSVAQACDMVGIDEATYGHKPRKPEVDDRLVQQSIVQLLTDDPTRSFDQCYTELRKLHPHWTRKQIKRVYREGRLYLQRRRSRKGSTEETGSMFPVHPKRPGAVWNLGAAPVDEGWLLFLLDDADAILLNTEALMEEPTQEILNSFLNRAMEENGKPRRLRVPDKLPFSVREISRWALQNKLSVLTLSMGKEENQLEVQGMEESAREQVVNWQVAIK
jgi:hypothetical protein